MKPAPWWKRAIAYGLDGVIVGAPIALIGTATDLARFVEVGDRMQFQAEPTLVFLSAVVTVLYSTAMDGGPRMASIGKMAMKLQVRDIETGEPIGFGRAASRRVMFLGLFYLVVLPGVVNAVWPLFDPNRQAWHDKAVRSQVVEAPI